MEDQQNSNSSESAKAQLSNKNVLENLAIAAFLSFWISSVGFAIFPSLAKPPLYLVWGSSGTISTHYTATSGQSRASRSFYYMDEEGTKTDIHTFFVVILTFLFYTAVCFVYINIRIFFIRRKNSKRE